MDVTFDGARRHNAAIGDLPRGRGILGALITDAKPLRLHSLGDDPRSVGFCHDAGMDYVSCSPYRVPIARLAAAQAQLEKPSGD